MGLHVDFFLIGVLSREDDIACIHCVVTLRDKEFHKHFQGLFQHALHCCLIRGVFRGKEMVRGDGILRFFVVVGADSAIGEGDETIPPVSIRRACAA